MTKWYLIEKGTLNNGWIRGTEVGGKDRPISSSDDGNQEGDDSIKEDSSDCAESYSEIELEDDVVRYPNLKFKLDCAALELDSVGRVHIHCNGPQCGEPRWQWRPKK